MSGSDAPSPGGADLASDNQDDAAAADEQDAPHLPPPITIVDRVPFVQLQPDSLMPKADFDAAYGSYQALHLRGAAVHPSASSPPAAKAEGASPRVQPLFASLGDQDKASWCVENAANRPNTDDGGSAAESTPDEFLDTSSKRHRGYCSFLVQRSKSPLAALLAEGRLPVRRLPVADASGAGAMEVRHGPCLWWFFGANYPSEGTTSPGTLRGRPEHTDSVSHDGTWHYQLSGTKVWRLRPTDEMLQRMGGPGPETSLAGTKRKADATDNDDTEGARYIEVECKEGDLLLLNTRLWWHGTRISPQPVPCISYARDIFLPKGTAATSATGPNEEDDTNHEAMTNVDGTYAAADIDADTILFTERTLPDCELHRSATDFNCQIVEVEDEATGERCMAVASVRDIRAGEFFCLAESDDDDEEEEEGSGEEAEEWEEEDGA
ncbi:hypothetical protein ACHAXT_006855 [Thalassiosira profunda]